MRVLSVLLVSVSTFFVPDSVTTGVKIVTRQVTGTVADIRTEYVTANRLRSEWQIRVGEQVGPPMASIVQQRNGASRVVELDLKAHEYATYDTDSQGAALGAKLRPMPSSGGVLHIWIDNTDTGERLIMFGHMARHIITREKRIASAGACSANSESETDGWYIDDSVMPDWHRDKKGGGGVVVAAMSAVGASSACFGRNDAIEVHRHGADPGFPLKMTTTMRTPMPSLDGRTVMVASNWGAEVMEFQEGPLDPKLFEVPSDFRKVEALKNWFAPAPRKQLSSWEWFKEKLAQLFD